MIDHGTARRKDLPIATLTRRAQLLLLADGFFGGLVAIGVTELNVSPDEFDFRMGRAWRVWTPAGRAEFPVFQIGQHDFREVLSRLHASKLPFKRYWPSLEARPGGMAPDDYLLQRCPAATPEEWKALARAFMTVE